MVAASPVGRRLEIEGGFEEVNDWLYEHQMTDGLPVIPPTEEKVAALLKGTKRDPAEEIGLIPPRWGVATVEAVAANGVMAGCRPEYLPVLLTAVEAMLAPEFNLYGIQATTHPLGPGILVNGPVAARLDINGKNNCFGQGWRANATIGRALRLVLLNIGGGLPGKGDKSTAGWPGKFTMCFAENEEALPAGWDPLHVERGFRRDQSTVTIIGAGGYHNSADLWSTTAEGVLRTIAYGMAAKSSHLGEGGDPLCALCPEHAAIIAGGGFSKAQVKEFLYQHARAPLIIFSDEIQESFRASGSGRAVDDQGRLMIADQAEEITVIVAGGPGPHSAFIPSWGRTVKSVTRLIGD